MGDPDGLPEAKRSRGENPQSIETHEDAERRKQRELRAAAAEKRFSPVAAPSSSPAVKQTISVQSKKEKSVSTSSIAQALEVSKLGGDKEVGSPEVASPVVISEPGRGAESVGDGGKLDKEVADRLFEMVFGIDVVRSILEQWSRQGFRFSTAAETSLGLVQREGGPCGVLAPIQALTLKHLLFLRDGSASRSRQTASLVFTEQETTQPLVRAMAEALWTAGESQAAVVVGLEQNLGKDGDETGGSGKAGGAPLLLDSGEALQSAVVVRHCKTIASLRGALEEALPALRGPLGALLLLFSALLSRGLEMVQSDRDDPSHPLVTRPFGHASQEIVNLLLCGRAVANVFDGDMDLGGGMCLKGIPGQVQVGFLTLLESLNLCKVGGHLKKPRWPIWVVGSESHYTVLFALLCSVQEESDSEDKEAAVRKAFDAFDKSDGGGFIAPEDLPTLLQLLRMDLPADVSSQLTANQIVVWNEFWQAVCNLEQSRGGLKGLVDVASQQRQFILYHFNGIAKTVANSGGGLTSSSSERLEQRPRLTKMLVTVPPRWTPNDMLVDTQEITQTQVGSVEGIVNRTPQHAPLIDCIRTRWPRATACWDGDPPSIV